jgi:hypothetical protein
VSDPLGLLPIAIAAGGGRVDGFEAQQLVAAGLVLLQRSAPLVRALSGRRSAILLPTSQAFVTALAASEGPGAVFINPLASRVEAAYRIADANVGAAARPRSRCFHSRICSGSWSRRSRPSWRAVAL